MATISALSPAKRAVLESRYDSAIPQEAIDAMAEAPEPGPMPAGNRVVASEDGSTGRTAERIQGWILRNRAMLAEELRKAESERLTFGRIGPARQREINYWTRCIANLQAELAALPVEIGRAAE